MGWNQYESGDVGTRSTSLSLLAGMEVLPPLFHFPQLVGEHHPGAWDHQNLRPLPFPAQVLLQQLCAFA